jgi:hypothetical protein
MSIYKEYSHRQQINRSDDPRQFLRAVAVRHDLPVSPYLPAPSRSSSGFPVASSATESISTEKVGVADDYKGCFAMEMDPSSALKSINASRLSAIVRKSLHRDTFQIQGWRVRKLDGGEGNPVSVGLYRFEGTGKERNEWIDWSVILKIIQSPANVGLRNFGDGHDQSHWNYWKRELLVYQSGLLETLPEGLVAPHCYEAIELPGNVAGLWLEDINDSYGGDWTFDRYALAARHLGRLNGSYISARPLPAFPWFSVQRARQWLNSVPWQAFPWEHPLVLDHYPRPMMNSFRRMLLDNERFLARLERLPKTVCHGDTYPTNLKSRRMKADHQEQTVAMDWALAGIEPLGDDLGQLVYGACMKLNGVRLAEVRQTLFESYLDGLADSGCRLDPNLVRFGYTALAAFRVGLYQLILLGEELKQSNPISRRSAQQPTVPYPFEVAMADEAYELLDAI